ncbi:MAG: N-acetylmuramoyl-L-alanine amidase [Chloroflexota bacterium]
MDKLVWIGNRWKACDTVGTTTRSGWPEHRFNWLVAALVKSRLQALGATVVLSRPSDTGYGPCITTRAQLGAKVHAALKLSIHADGAATGNHGFFVMRPGLVKGYTDDIVSSSYKLAKAVRSGLLKVGLSWANYYATDGIKARTDMGGLNMSDVPAVMVELGNMKNAGDAARMQSSSGRAKYANGLVAGIRIFLGK